VLKSKAAWPADGGGPGGRLSSKIDGKLWGDPPTRSTRGTSAGLPGFGGSGFVLFNDVGPLFPNRGARGVGAGIGLAAARAAEQE